MLFEVFTFVSGHHNQSCDTNFPQCLKCAVNQRYAIDFQHTFGVFASELSKSFAHSGGEYQCLHFISFLSLAIVMSDGVSGSSMSSPWQDGA